MANYSNHPIKKIEFIVNENGCHICTSHCKSHGYPFIRRNGKNYNMGRYLWEEKYGPISDEIQICHRCDTPACINMDHFFLGTFKDNMDDKCNKGRARGAHKGENHNNVKLTEKQVLQIRQESGTQQLIAEKYGISYQQVGRIKNRKTWRWL